MRKKIIVLAICFLAILTVTFAVYNTPRWNDAGILTETEFTFCGDRYKFVTNYPTQYEFKPDKFIAYSGGIFFGKTYYSVKNDEDKEYIYVSELGEKYVYFKVQNNYK